MQSQRWPLTRAVYPAASLQSGKAALVLVAADGSEVARLDVPSDVAQSDPVVSIAHDLLDLLAPETRPVLRLL